METDTRPRVWQVNLLVFLVAIPVVFLGGAIHQVTSTSWGLLFTEVVLILLPTLAFMGLGGRRGWFWPREVLALRRIDLGSAGLSLLMGFAVWPLAGLIATLVDEILSRIVGTYEAAISPPSGPLDAMVYLFAFAGAAAVCEELLFRGVVMRAYQGQGLSLAVFYTAALFGLFHFNLASLLAVTFIGLLLGYVTTRCQSVYAAMLAHAATNVLAATFLIFQEALLPVISSIQLALAPVAVAALILGWFLLRRHTEPPPEPAERDRPAWRDWTFWVTVLPTVLFFLLIAALELALRAGVFDALLAM